MESEQNSKVPTKSYAGILLRFYLQWVCCHASADEFSLFQRCRKCRVSSWSSADDCYRTMLI